MLVTSIGNFVGLARLVRSAVMHNLMIESQYKQGEIRSHSQNEREEVRVFKEASDYLAKENIPLDNLLEVIISALKPALAVRSMSNHLRYFYLTTPALMMSFTDNILALRDQLESSDPSNPSKDKLVLFDDGFALGSSLSI